MRKDFIKKTILIASITGCVTTSVYSGVIIKRLSKDVESKTKEIKSIKLQSKFEKEELTTQIEELRTSNEDLETRIGELRSVNEILEQTIKSMEDEVSFNPNDISETSGATEYHLNKALQGTNLQTLAPVLVKAEKEYNINAYVLASIVALESSWGNSERANNGSNNLTGYAVYSNVSRGTHFSSWEECVIATAKLLRNDYLNLEGQHHNGTSITSINKKYSADPEWSSKVTSIANNLIKKSNS